MEALAGPAPDAEPACGFAGCRLFRMGRSGPVAGPTGTDGFGSEALATTLCPGHQPFDHGGTGEWRSQLVEAAIAEAKSGKRKLKPSCSKRAETTC